MCRHTKLNHHTSLTCVPSTINKFEKMAYSTCRINRTEKVMADFLPFLEGLGHFVSPLLLLPLITDPLQCHGSLILHIHIPQQTPQLYLQRNHSSSRESPKPIYLKVDHSSSRELSIPI